ncbi:general stress protein [Paenibacillus sp. WLX1005]|uniref:general stress protein n=1 Tax=unclassified Paenibacillus TaxID=185978 RepID=UPI0039845B38
MLNNEHNRNDNLQDETRKIVGVFVNEEEASQAIRDLKDEGFSSDDISIVGKNRRDLRELSEETGTKAPEGLATGAATGGVIGGVAGLLAGLGIAAIPIFGPIMAAGPIAVALTGAAAGAGAGGLVGGLIGLGIPEEEAKEYETNINEGNILVMVDSAAGNRGRIYDVFRRNNATNSRYFDTTATAATTTVTDATGTPPIQGSDDHVNGVFTTEESEQRLHRNDPPIQDRNLADRNEWNESETDRNMRETLPLMDGQEDRDMLNEPIRRTETNGLDEANRRLNQDDPGTSQAALEAQRLNRTGQPVDRDLNISTPTTGVGTSGALGANMDNTEAVRDTDYDRTTEDESLRDKTKDLLERGKDKIDRTRK